MEGNVSNEKVSGRRVWVALAVFFTYVVVLALAAVSELFDLGWFNHPIFK